MDLIIKTEQGLVEGMLSADGQSRIFKGVPYAEAPVGELRFKRSQPKKPWIGVRTCKSFGPQAWQADKTKGDDVYPKEFYTGDMPPMSEDCLYLNIWTPSELPEEKLPVLMWIHGGAYMHGYGAEKTMDGEGLNRKGVIMVSINYRVGALGFFAHDELERENPEGISGNYGMWDQVTALKWIYDNIEAFGGDKNKITVAGQSAGCMSTTTLICSELTKGQISSAILQSGGGLPGFARNYELEDQKKASRRLMEILGVNTVAELREISAESVCNAGYMVNAELQGLNWMPNVDGYLLKESVIELQQKGMHHDIPYMIGSTKDEMGNGTAEMLEKSAVGFAVRMEELGRRPVYIYKFSRDLPGSNDGAFHSSELWYEFETLDRCWRPMEEIDYRISNEMSSAFASFIKSGNPSCEACKDWEAYTKDNKFVKEFK